MADSFSFSAAHSIFDKLKLYQRHVFYIRIAVSKRVDFIIINKIIGKVL